MATVTIDISEYDMLRNGKEQAEAEVKALKEDIKGLKDKSRVIVTTVIKKAVSDWGSYYPTSELQTVSTSTQLTGFDDVELMVREKLTKDIQADLDAERIALKTSRRIYEEKQASMKSDFKKQFDEKEKELNEEFGKKERAYNQKIEKLGQEVTDSAAKIKKYQEILQKICKIPAWIRRLFGGAELSNLNFNEDSWTYTYRGKGKEPWPSDNRFDAM